ncbi:MAG: hypothetical protein ACK53Y_06360, partial [bacterium]
DDNYCTTTVLYNVHSSIKILQSRQLTLGLKGIDRPFGGGVESILIRSILVNWRLGYFFYLILKGLRHKISKKPVDAAK